MYIPMGASKTRYINVWIIFIFVALWHDINMDLLLFGFGNALTMVV